MAYPETNLSYDQELRRLYDLEYGDRIEFILRIAVILVAALLYYLYEGSVLAFVWVSGFLFCQLVYFLLLSRRGQSAEATIPYAVGGLAFVQASYFWLPAQLLTADDVVLIIGGLAGTLTMMFFMLRRGDALLSVVIAETVIVCVGAVLLTLATMTRFETTLQRVCVAFCIVMLAFFFAVALFKARELRLSSLAAAERTAQEQKLASIGRLAGGVAHDFNNALTGISGNLELYFEVEDEKEQRELIQGARASAGRAATLVKQLLVFARQTGIERKRYAADELIIACATFQRRLLPASIRLEVGEAVPADVMADKDLFVTALINLAVNAVDAMPDGGVLTLEATRFSPQNPVASVDGRRLVVQPYIRFAVRDTGEGIPLDMVTRVIEPFFSTKPVGKGSGLGLAMVVGLAQSLDGGVLIDSSPEGTEVSILLPLAPDDPIPAD